MKLVKNLHLPKVEILPIFTLNTKTIKLYLLLITQNNWNYFRGFCVYVPKNKKKCWILSVKVLEYSRILALSKTLQQPYQKSRFKNKITFPYLAGVTQLIRVLSCSQKVVGSISGQGACLGCGLDPQSWCGRYNPWSSCVRSPSRCIWEATHLCFSLA